jgi:transposase-like protein
MSVKKRRSRRTYSPEFRSQVLAQIQAGQPVIQVCREHGLHRSCVDRWRKLGTGHGNGKGGRPSRITPEQKAAALQELAAGGKAKEIAARLGITDAAVYLWRKNGAGTPKTNGARTHQVVVSRALPLPAPAGAVELQHAARDATLLLRKAKSELMGGIRTGRIADLDQAHLLSLLALSALQGG